LNFPNKVWIYPLSIDITREGPVVVVVVVVIVAIVIRLERKQYFKKV
jgi:hypothetical protein